MNATQRCPKCCSPLTADAPAGLCPKCLLQRGLESEASPKSGDGETAPSPGAVGFTPPSIGELTKSFPQLEILELLGQGGMGAVYKARQPGLDRLVAVKILPPQVGRDPSFAERFTREARALARLSHPNIVGVHDFGTADGLYYFIMEYVEGTNLRQTITAGTLQPVEALAIVPQICDALQYAHDEGVVHRDIKPENILLDKKGRVKIADFGLSKLLGEERLDFSLTGTHQVMGTLRYMAPEQMKGTRTVDHRADIYSLGVVFYELLTGDVPMGRFDPPSHRVQVDVRLDEVVLRTLAQEPDKRYQRASEVKTGIEEIKSRPAIQHAGYVPPQFAAERPMSTAQDFAHSESAGVRKINGGLLVLGVVLLFLLPVLGLGLALLFKSMDLTWLILLAAVVILPLVLAAATLFIALGLRGRKVESAANPGGSLTAGTATPTRASNTGLVVAIVAILLAVTCVPVGAVVLVALGAAVFWVVPTRSAPAPDVHEAVDSHRMEEGVTRPLAPTLTEPERNATAPEVTTPD